MTVSVTNLAGPFKVTAPDSAVTWNGGTVQTVEWLVANTDFIPVNAFYVNIRLSTNGGQTFPFILKANTLNDGSEVVVIPNVGTSDARIMVEAVGNIFFDISDASFTILGPTAASVGGRIVNQSGKAIKGATVTLTAPDGAARTAMTDSFGNYVFGDVPLGETYTITPSLRRYSFTPASIAYDHLGQTSSQNFTGTTR
jgi:hypothetical protein